VRTLLWTVSAHSVKASVFDLQCNTLHKKKARTQNVSNHESIPESLKIREGPVGILYFKSRQVGSGGARRYWGGPGCRLELAAPVPSFLWLLAFLPSP